MQHVRETYPDAQYYLNDDQFHLMLGESHTNKRFDDAVQAEANHSLVTVTQRNMPALIAQAREVAHDTRAVNYIDGAYIVPNSLRWIAMNHNGEVVGFDFEPDSYSPAGVWVAQPHSSSFVIGKVAPNADWRGTLVDTGRFNIVNFNGHYFKVFKNTKWLTMDVMGCVYSHVTKPVREQGAWGDGTRIHTFERGAVQLPPWYNSLFNCEDNNFTEQLVTKPVTYAGELYTVPIWVDYMAMDAYRHLRGFAEMPVFNERLDGWEPSPGYNKRSILIYTGPFKYKMKKPSITLVEVKGNNNE